jgi:hypothetical protein
MSSRILFGLFIVAFAVLLSNHGIDAWSATATSSFGGRMLSSTIQNGARIEMKKGKANVPPQMRGQYKKQQELAQMQREMMEASRPGADGLPVFNLYVRTKRQNVRWSQWHGKLFIGNGCITHFFWLSFCLFVDLVPMRKFQRRRTVGSFGQVVCRRGYVVGYF